MLPDYTGGLGNRLLVYSHIMAAACAYGFRAWNAALLPYRGVVAGQEKNPCNAFPPSKEARLSPRVFRGLRRWIAGTARLVQRHGGSQHLLGFHHQPDGRELDLQGSVFTRLLRSYRWLVLWGYPYRSEPLREKHAQTVREFLQPSRFWAQKAAEILGPLRAGGCKVVAVHVRQGDYRGFSGGRYFFETAAYVLRAGEWLRRAGHHGEKIHFVVCSDTPQDPALWASLPSSISLRPVALDYSLMTAADFCLAPPSSLSEMACWVGGVPRILLKDASSPLPEIAYGQGRA